MWLVNPGKFRWNFKLTGREDPAKAGSSADQQPTTATQSLAKSVQARTDGQNECGKNNMRALLTRRPHTGGASTGILESVFYSVYSAKTGNDAVSGWCPLPPPFGCG